MFSFRRTESTFSSATVKTQLTFGKLRAIRSNENSFDNSIPSGDANSLEISIFARFEEVESSCGGVRETIFKCVELRNSVPQLRNPATIEPAHRSKSRLMTYELEVALR